MLSDLMAIHVRPFQGRVLGGFTFLSIDSIYGYSRSTLSGSGKLRINELPNYEVVKRQ